MAASTRSGLPGGFSGGNGPTDVQSARTLYGHDLHLDRADLDGAAVHEPADAEATAPARPVTQEEEFVAEKTDSMGGRSGKSRFPALARLFGRWNTRGDFESRATESDYEFDSIPRERLLRPLAIVVATAAISFFIVVGLLKLRDSTGGSPPVTAAPAPAIQPAFAVPPAAPVRPAVATPLPPHPAPAPTQVAPRSRPLSDVLQRALAQREAPPPAVKRTVSRRPRRLIVPADPDSPMPLSF
jgi:hypothetical protein